MSNRPRLAIALAVLLTAACSSDDPTGPEGPVERNWSAQASGQVIPVQLARCGEGQIGTGSGQMTINGTAVQTDAAISQCVTDDNRFTLGQFTITSADGTLVGAHEGAVTGPPDENGVVPILIQGTIIGGTGAYAGASGSGDFAGPYDLTNGEFHLTMEGGTLTY